MPESKINLHELNNLIRKDGQIVGETDIPYSLPKSKSFIINEILVKGDLSGVLDYNDFQIKIIGIDSIIGLKVTPFGARGPIWEKVNCEVL